VIDDDYTDDDTLDILEAVAEMRANNGHMGLVMPISLTRYAQRGLQRDVSLLRQFGYS
jgi:hypothetical protein